MTVQELVSNNIIDKTLLSKLKPMVVFKNIAVHENKNVNFKVVKLL